MILARKARLFTLLALIVGAASAAAEPPEYDRFKQPERYLASIEGDVDAAVDFLLHLPQRNRERAAYALERLAILARQGVVSRADVDLTTHYRNYFSHLVDRGRHAEAGVVLQEQYELDGDNAVWRLQRAHLLTRVLREDLAAEEFRELTTRLAYPHSVSFVSSLLSQTQTRLQSTQERATWTGRARREEPRLRLWLSEISTRINPRDAASLHEAIDVHAKRGTMLRDEDDPNWSRSYWQLLHHALSVAPTNRIAPLRHQQEEAWREAVEAGLDRAADSWRRFPWAESTQRAQLDEARDWLEGGEPQLAERTYRDLLAQGLAPDLEAPARVGLALGLAARADEGATPTTSTNLPWTILPAPDVTTHHPALFHDQRRGGPVNGRQPPAIEVLRSGDRLIVAAPRYLAVYNAAQPRRPLWTRTGNAQWSPSQSERDASVPQRLRPAIGRDRLFTRWGYSDHGLRDMPGGGGHGRVQVPATRSRRLLLDVACFDIADGRMLWSTKGRPEWRKRVPIGDPAVYGSRVFIPVVRSNPTHLAEKTPRVALVALNASDGTPLWERELGTARILTSPKGATHVTGLSGYSVVHNGAVYTATSGGLVACVDARDGLCLWRRQYPGFTPPPAAIDLHAQRSGSSLFVDGERLVVHPRDQAGIFALVAATGELVWDNPFLASDHVAGIAGGVLVTHDESNVAGVDRETGAVRWQLTLPNGIRGLAAVADDHACGLASPACGLASTAWALSGTELIRISARTGRLVDARPAPTPEAPENIAVAGASLVSVATRAAATKEAGLTRGGFADADGHWHLRRLAPRLYAPEEGEPLADWLFLSSEGAVEGIRRSAPGEIQWRRLVPTGVRGVAYAGRRIALRMKHAMMIVDGESGALRGRWQSMYPLYDCKARGDRLAIHSQYRWTGLDAATGEVAWERKAPSTQRAAGLVADGLCIVADHFDAKTNGKRWAARVTIVNLDDGSDVRQFDALLGTAKPAQAVIAGASLWVITADRHLFHVDLGSETVTTHGNHMMASDVMRKAETRNLKLRPLDAGGERIAWQADLGYLQEGWIFRGGERTKPFAIGLNRRAVEFIGDNRFREFWGRRVRELDLRTGKVELVYTLPASCHPLALHERDGLVYIASRRRPFKAVESPVWSRDFRVDVYAAADRQHLGGMRLPGLRWSSWRLPDIRPAWENELAWGDETLFITDAYGLHAIPLKGLEQNDERTDRLIVVPRSDAPIRLDAEFTEKVGAVHVQDREPSSLHLSHNRDYLHIAVTCVNRSQSPLQGGVRTAAAGDYLELELATNVDPDDDGPETVYAWGAGLDVNGRFATQGDPPPGTLGAVRHDIADMTTLYELLVPLADVVRVDTPGDDRLQLSITVTDEEYGPGPADHWWALALRLDKFSVSERDAGLALAAELPQLPAAETFLDDVIDLQVHDWPGARRFIVGLLRGGDSPAFHARALRRLDDHVRDLSGLDPAAALADMAKEAGVSAKVAAWYQRNAGTWADPFPGADAPDRGAAIPLLREMIPRLGRNEIAAHYFATLTQWLRPDAAEELALVRDFVRNAPGHPRAGDYLTRLRELAMEAEDLDPRTFLDEVMDGDDVDRKIAYRIRRKYLYTDHAWLAHWHTVGPFHPDPPDDEKPRTALPPQQPRITLREQYRLPLRTLTWKSYRHDDGIVDLHGLYGRGRFSPLGYAVAWVEAPAATWAVLELGTFGPCRVWINRKQVFGGGEKAAFGWVPDGYQNSGRFPTTETTVPLAKGWNTILVENGMARRGWNFRAELIEPSGKGPIPGLRILTLDGPADIVVQRAEADSQPPVLGNSGFKGEYYDNNDFTDLKLVRKDATINFNWHVESPDPEIDWDGYSIRWTGRLLPRYSETYTLSATADDGIRLWIDGKLILDDWSYHPPKKGSVQVDLVADVPVDLKLEYHEGDNRSHVSLYWQSASQPREIIPAERVRSSWLDPPIGPTGDTGPPTRMAPKEAWVPPGGSVRFEAVFVNLFGDIIPTSIRYDSYGDRINPDVPVDGYGESTFDNITFDSTGNPAYAPANWSLHGGATAWPHAFNGAARLLENTDLVAGGRIDSSGLFVSDGTPGVLRVIARRDTFPARAATATIVVGNYPSINPSGNALRIGSAGYIGDLRRLRLYNVALDDATLAAHAGGSKPMADGLVADWIFAEPESGGFKNRAGDGLVADIVGAVKSMRDDNGDGFVRFHTGRKGLEVADDPRLRFVRDCTVEAWIRPAEAKAGGSIVDTMGDHGRGYRLDLHNGLRSNAMHGELTATHTYSTNGWTHVASVFAGGGVRKLFIDGRLVAERKAQTVVSRVR